MASHRSPVGGGSTGTAVINERFAVVPGSQFAAYVEDYIRQEAETADGVEIQWLIDQETRMRVDWHSLCLRYMEGKRLTLWPG